MPYLLDTDTISAVLKPRPSLRVARELAMRPASEMYTSAINLGELVFGAVRHDRADLLVRIQAITDVLPVLPFDDVAAQRFGRLKAELERRGTPVAEPDLRIASIALANDLTLVTGNVRHFARIPDLTIENWLLE